MGQRPAVAHPDATIQAGQDVLLDPGVRIEPLVRRWAAWLMTLDPVNAAIYLAGHELPILQSFLRHPNRHASASQDPRTTSGPFANLAVSQTPLVDQWLTAMQESEHATLAVGEALLQLVRRPNDPIPTVLAGAVEAVRDPASESGWTVRLLRTVLRRRVSVGHESVAIWPGLRRPHFLNTPRLAADERFLHLDVAFDSDQLAQILRLRDTPVQVEEAIATLGFHGDEPHPMARALLRPAESVVHSSGPMAVSHDQPRVEFFGHCSIAISDAGTALLADPITPPVPGVHRLPARLDAVLISHGHPDHLVPEAMLALRKRVRLALVPATRSGSIADPSLRDCLLRLGIADVVALEPFMKTTIGSAVITALPFQGEHGGLDIGGKTTWHVRTPTMTVMLAADCACQEATAFDDVIDQFGAVDLLLTAMEPRGAPARWLYGPVMGASAEGRLDGADAAAVLRLARAVGAQRIGIYGCDDPPGAAHLFGRPAPRTADEQAMTVDTADNETARLRRLAGAYGVPVFTLNTPGPIDLSSVV